MQVDEIGSRGVDDAIGGRQTGLVIDQIQIESPLQPLQIEGVAGVGDAVQGQVDGHSGIAFKGQRVGQREQVGAILGDTMLEHHHRPAIGGFTVAAPGVGHGHQHRNLQRCSGCRQRVVTGDRATIGSHPIAAGGFVLAQIVGNCQRTGIDVGKARQVKADSGGGRAGRLDRHAQRLEGLVQRHEGIIDRLGHEGPAQYDAAPGHALTGSGAFLVINQLPQRFQRFGLRIADTGNHALAIGIDQRGGQLGQAVGWRGQSVVAAAVLNTIGQGHQIAGLGCQRPQRVNVQRSLVGVLRQQVDAVIGAGLQFAGHASHGERSLGGRVEEGIDQRHLKHPYCAAGGDGRRLQCPGELRGERRDGGEAVQPVHCDPWIGQIGRIADRKIQSAIGRAAEQQVVGKGHNASGGVKLGVEIGTGGCVSGATND